MLRTRCLNLLKVTKEVSSACPQLQLAVGALLLVLEAYKKYTDVNEAVEDLLSRVKTLNDALGKLLSSGYENCSESLRRRLDEFAKTVESITADAKKLKDRGRLRRIFSASDDKGKIQAWVEKLSWNVQSFILQGTIAVEHAVEQGFKNTDSRFDAVDERIKSLKDTTIDEADSNLPILWMYALPGVGKSTIALTAAGFWDADKVLGATFFCATSDGERSNIVAIFRTLAYQLARRFPEFRQALIEILDKDPDLYDAAPSRQLEKLIAEPVQVAEKQGAFKGRVPIVIDALDECRDKAAVSTPSAREHHEGFRRQALVANTQQFNLTDIRPDLTRRDIETFVRSRFEDIKLDYSHLPLPSDWPSQLQLTQLLTLADVLFIYASTAMLFIGDEKARDPRGQLKRLLESGNAAAKSGAQSFLDRLYEHVLEDVIEKLPEDQQSTLPRLLLGTLVLAEERLVPTTLASLIDVPSDVVKGVLPAFHAVLTTPAVAEDEKPIRLIHLSFTNFLVDPARCTNKTVLVNPRTHHAFIASRCLKLMQESLKYNICEVPSEHHHLPNNEVPDLPARIAQHLPPTLEYAARYWMRHLGNAEIGEDLLLTLEEFCDTRLLYWVEALSLLGCVDIAVEALRSTQLLLKQQNAFLRETQVPALLYDCERSVQTFYPVISTSFMEIYRTAIPYSPIDSLLRRCNLADVSPSVEVRLGLEKTWSTTLASRATVFGSIQALSFSPDGHEILSGSFDTTARLWDVATGACLHTWTEHSDHEVGSVAWSPDGLVVASGDGDGAVLLRKINLPERTVVLQHENWVGALIFATDGYIASGSDDETCKIWDTKSIDWDATDHSPRRTLTHSSMVREVAVSLDSCLVACGQESGEIVLWSKSDGERLRSIPGRTKVISLAFYADNHLAAGYWTSPFILWDVSTATRLDTLDTSNTVYIRRWGGNELRQSGPTTTAQSSLATRMRPHLGSHSPASLRTPGMRAGEVVDDTVTRLVAVAVSPSGALILAVYEDQWRLWDVSNGPPRCMRSAEHPAFDRSVASWSSTGNLFALTGKSNVISVWETQTGQCVRAFAGHSDMVTAVVFTADERHVLSASWDGSIRRWDVRSTPRDAPSEVLFQADGDMIGALAVSSDGRWMLSCSGRRGSPPDISSADLLARPFREPEEYSGWYSALRLHDSRGRVVWTENYFSVISAVAFSEDCSRAVVGDNRGNVYLYDLTQLIPPDKSALRSHQPRAVPEYQLSSGSMRTVWHVSFSLDDHAIVTETGYIALPPKLQPLSKRDATASCPPSYFLTDDGWLWRVDLKLNHRRIRWVPPSFRPHHDNFAHTWSSTHGHGIACRTSDGRLVVLDVSQY
ncbi:hypothetical protein FKP32DRAFT_1607004 [Trametes sanguinea]|nr:hypothetical protein FKP32DRAFT_1607004 [Trametes sanguinea]